MEAPRLLRKVGGEEGPRGWAVRRRGPEGVWGTWGRVQVGDGVCVSRCRYGGMAYWGAGLVWEGPSPRD